MTCDDKCEFYVSKIPDVAIDENTAAADYVELKHTGSTGYRSYFTVTNSHADGSKYTPWVSLTKGDKYYMEGLHIDTTGNDHFAVAMEFKRAANAVSHFHQMKET